MRYQALAGGRFDVEAVPTTDGSDGSASMASSEVRLVASDVDGLALELDRVRRQFLVARDGDALTVHGAGGCSELTRVPRFPPPVGAALVGGCVAPMTGVIRKVCVAVGDRVARGDLLLVLEAMKMEHRLEAQTDGLVSEVRVREGQMVDPDDVLVVVEAAPPPA